MKKALLVVITVLLLIVLTWKLDKVTRVKPKASTNDTVQADATLGTLAPNVTFKDLDGKNVPLSQYRGKVVLVNFWADRKSTRLNSSHLGISYAVFCLKKKTSRS